MARHLLKGSVLNGYRLTCATSTSNAGTSLWAFAEKQGRDYFVKSYLHPVYPLDDAPGSAPSKELKRRRCQSFEQRMVCIKTELNRLPADQCAARIVDFFRCDAFYYAVSEKIDAHRIEIAALAAPEQLVLLMALAEALALLHQQTRLIHGDIKPENMLIRRHGQRFIAKLVDFDSAFVDNHPPLGLSVDQRYRSPERVAYQNDSKHATLDAKSDVFALGVVFCEYLTGSLPILSDGHPYIGEALANGGTFELLPSIHRELRPVLETTRAMLRSDPTQRPSCAEVHHDLRLLHKKLFLHRVYHALPRLLPLLSEPLQALSSRPAQAKPSALRIRGLNARPPSRSPLKYLLKPRD